MQVTSVKINRIKEYRDDGLLAYASIVLEDELIINSIKVMDNGVKRFIIFPERFSKNNDTNGKPVAFSVVNPTKTSLRDSITSAIFALIDSQYPYNNDYETTESIVEVTE
jgi:DNA-binding cell septation regulator SpoVG